MCKPLRVVRVINPARLLVLIVAMCALPLPELAQESRIKGWIGLDLYQEGYRADREGDYITAFKKLSSFRKINRARLAESTTSDEIAFRRSLDAELGQLDQKIREGNEDRRWNVPGGAGQGDRGQTVRQPSGFTRPSAGANTVQSNETSSSGQTVMPIRIPPASSGANIGQYNRAHISVQIVRPPVSMHFHHR